MQSGALAPNTEAIGKSLNDVRGSCLFGGVKGGGVETMAIEAIKRLEPPSLVRYAAPDAKLDTSSGMLNDVADGAIKAGRPIKRPIKEELIEAIRNAPGISRPQLMVVAGKGRTSVTEALASLQKDGLIEHRGSRKTGGILCQRVMGRTVSAERYEEFDDIRRKEEARLADEADMEELRRIEDEAKRRGKDGELD